MEIKINGNAKEIAELVSSLQAQPKENKSTISVKLDEQSINSAIQSIKEDLISNINTQHPSLYEVLQKATCDIRQEN